MRLWTLFASFLINFALLFTACSDHDKNAGGTSEAENSIAINDKTVAGVTQKGPFTKGSNVTLYELNFGTLAQTGKSFIGKISDSTGSFSINKIELASQYALLQAEGYYLNEITGKVSASQIALNAISDLSERDKVNINLLTHLEYERAGWLTNENEMTIKDAKVKADKEIFSAFGVEYNGDRFEDLDIFGRDDADAALLAISVIMHSGRSEGEFSLALANMAMDLEKDGKWDDAKAIAEAADNSFEADTAQIRMNMEAWNIAESIPDFAPIVEYFWNDAFGLGRCTEKREGEIKPDSNSHSRYFEKDFICVKSHWYLFNQETHFYANQMIYEKCGGKTYDPSTQECFRATVEGICGKKTFDLKSETCIEGVIMGLCGSKIYDKELQFCNNETLYDRCGGGIYRPDREFCFDQNIYPYCGGSDYDLTTEFCYNSKIYGKCNGIEFDPSLNFCLNGKMLPKHCNNELYDTTTQFCYGETVLSKCGSEIYDPNVEYCTDNTLVEIIDASNYDALNNTLTDLRDGQVYRTTVIAPEGTDYSEIWMAENLNYTIIDSYLHPEETINSETYGKLYKWDEAVAMSGDECGLGHDCPLPEGDIRGICPKGWHLPSKDEWEELIVAVDGSITEYDWHNTAGTKLKSTSGWNNDGNGTDDYGFCGLPAGTDEGGEGSKTVFWSSSEANLHMAYHVQLTDSYVYASLIGPNEDDWKSDFYSVRCIKDTAP